MFVQRGIRMVKLCFSAYIMFGIQSFLYGCCGSSNSGIMKISNDQIFNVNYLYFMFYFQ